MLRSWLSSAVLAISTASPMGAAFAQTAPAAAPAPDPARLALAQALVQRLVPPEKRDAMIDQMMRPMIQSMRTALLSSPNMASIRAQDAEAGAKFDSFMNAEFERSLATAKAVLPKMMDAMARAYARRFSAEELKAIGAFFETPAGQAYAERSPMAMADPDVIAVMTAMIQETQAGAEERLDKLMSDLGADTKTDR